MLSFITGNQYKFAEIKQIIPDIVQLKINLTEIQELDPQKIIQHKLQEAFLHHSGPFMVEDTSLYLDCLNGLPGPFGKWFEEKLGNDGMYNLVTKMGNPKAKCAVIIGFAKDKNQIKYFEGSCEGIIVAPKTKDPFGFNNVFQPNGFYKVFAEMSIEEKNKISMRGTAARKLKEFLEIQMRDECES
ncbi:MAG TPA: non-canonical purine NTP pyrophosphatase [Patescibacteria group bacterium]|nr:non-canonical purine NTP pyrophosphatase [Patescibacteria group bacterium]